MLEWSFYGNSLLSWSMAALAGVLTLVALVLVRRLLSLRLQLFASRTRTRLDDVIASTLDATRLWFKVVLAVWAGSLVLTLEPALHDLIAKGATLALMLQVGIWAAVAIGSWVEVYGTAKLEQGDGASVTTMRAVGFLGRLAVWVVALLVVLDTVFQVDITALVAGLGIGGIAVALALQNILSDLFGSLSIVLDKPFVAGDFIVVGDMSGTVERVGLKTTRIRSLSGEQLIFSNSDLLSSRIRNFKRMSERRVVFTFGVTYQTPLEKLERIPAIVRDIVVSHETARFDRAHFRHYGPSSLDFEVVYHVTVPDYNAYMDLQQAINFALYERFESEGIDFAYPTQTLYLAREGRSRAGDGARQRATHAVSTGR
jgi:small-conductance mechanosensitive channel